MALDKLVDSTQLDSDLTSVANAIRTKGGTSAQLAFPADFVAAINAISGGGGLSIDWADVTEVTVGANSVTNMTGVQTYFSGYTYRFVLLASALTVNNQFVLGFSNNADGTMNTGFRYKNGGIGTANIASNYDAVLVEGTKYYLLTIK